MSDAVLTANSRGHSAEDVRKASNLIRKFGFELGLQMMVGLYKSTPELDLFTAEEIIKLAPDTVRVYPTVILKNTDLAKLFKSGEYTPFSMETAIELCSELIIKFKNAGIKIIKLGLHASEIVECEMLGGIYHPAFRELCESRIFFRKINQLLENKSSGSYSFCVCERSISKAVGQKKENIKKLEKIGFNIKIMPSNKLSDDEIIIAEEEIACT
jgi:histone acetyltransferase (RNA polymerase elongator complex component)